MPKLFATVLLNLKKCLNVDSKKENRENKLLLKKKDIRKDTKVLF